jgi:hypothetical protein
MTEGFGGSGMSVFPGPQDRSREKQLVHDHTYRPGGPASEQLHIKPPKNPAPEPEPSAPVRLARWISSTWRGE